MFIDSTFLLFIDEELSGVNANYFNLSLCQKMSLTVDSPITYNKLFCFFNVPFSIFFLT